MSTKTLENDAKLLANCIFHEEYAHLNDNLKYINSIRKTKEAGVLLGNMLGADPKNHLSKLLITPPSNLDDYALHIYTTILKHAEKVHSVCFAPYPSTLSYKQESSSWSELPESEFSSIPSYEPCYDDPQIEIIDPKSMAQAIYGPEFMDKDNVAKFGAYLNFIQLVEKTREVARYIVMWAPWTIHKLTPPAHLKNNEREIFQKIKTEAEALSKGNDDRYDFPSLDWTVPIL